MFTKDRTDTIKNLFDIIRQLFLLAMVTWFVVENKHFRDFFSQRGLNLETSGFLGSILPGVKVRDQLEDSNAAIRVANLANDANQRVLKDTQAQLQSVKDELNRARDQLQTVRSGSPPPAGGLTTNAAPQISDQTMARIDRLLGALSDTQREAGVALGRSNAAAAVLEDVARRNDAVLNPNSLTGWLVVFGSDATETAAFDEVKRAAEKGLPNGVVIHRGRVFHPALRYASEAEARAKLESVRGLSRYSSGAFPVAEAAFCAGGLTPIDKRLTCQTSR